MIAQGSRPLCELMFPASQMQIARPLGEEEIQRRKKELEA